MVADGLSLGGKAQFHNEKAKLDGNGVAIPSDRKSTRLNSSH